MVEMECDSKPHSVPPFSVEKAFAGTILYPPGGTCGPRVKKYFQLVLLHTGKMEVSVDGVIHHITQGNLVLMKPGHLEYFVFAKDQETWHRWIDISLEYITEETLNFFENMPFSIPISYEMNRLIDLMLDLQQSGNLVQKMVLRSLGLTAMMLYISECHTRETCNTHPLIYFTKNLIHNRFQTDLTLRGLAEDANVTPQHLIRLFRKYENMTPIQYLWSYRVEQGVNMLQKTGLSIKEIADRTGFKTTYHFARVVKRHTGYSPTQLRDLSWMGSRSELIQYKS